MNVVSFDFEYHKIRIVRDEKGDPWFNANDVCEAMEMSNPRKAIADHVDQEDVTKRDTQTAGGIQQQTHFNESGLYSLILGSRKPEAKRFKRWVTSVVLPEIRKTGSYSPEVPQTMAEALRLAADLCDKIEQQRPAVEFFGRYVEAKSSKSLSDVAKVLGWKPQEFIRELHGLGIIFKRGNSWVPYQDQIDCGRFTVKTGEENGHAYVQARIEPKGMAYLANLLGKESN